MPSERTVERLSLYRHLLVRLRERGEKAVHSHKLASMANVTAAQVRHDMMAIGYSGSPNNGYDIERLVESIGEFLDTPLSRNIALVGVGNLGRAILADFVVRRPLMKIVAAFDVEPDVYGRVIHGCWCYPMEDLESVLRENRVAIAVVAVPAGEAQRVADQLVDAGVCGILNFAPVRLRVPQHVYVADVNITVALEKVTYFASQKAAEKDMKV